MGEQLTVTRLGSGDIDTASELLAQAFNDQPYETYYEPDARRRLKLLREAFRRHVRQCVQHGEPLGAGEPLAGVALVAPPQAGRAAVDEYGDSSDDWVAIFGEPALARAAPLRDLLRYRHEQDMKVPHWYLSILGVAPCRQGVGVGGALLRAVMARADHEGLPCYLDTAQPRNLPFYRRHGFEVLTAGVEPVSGLPYWTFCRGLRPPRKAPPSSKDPLSPP